MMLILIGSQYYNIQVTDMKRSKNLNASMCNLTSQKPLSTKNAITNQPLSSKLTQSIKSCRKDSMEFDLCTSRTNKQNISKKVQIQTSIKPKKLSYSNLHSQKKQYLSQSLILNESLLTNRKEKQVGDKLQTVRNELRDLLSINEDVESNFVEEPPSMQSIIEELISQSIIRSQAQTIAKLQFTIETLTDQIQQISSSKEQCQREYSQKLFTLQSQLQEKIETVSLKKYQQLSEQLRAVSTQNESLKKEVFTYRKDNCVVKRELQVLKKNKEGKGVEYGRIQQELEGVKEELRYKTNWLTTLQFQKEKLEKQLIPDQMVVELESERSMLQEYIYGVNKSLQCLQVKLTLTQREHQRQIQEMKSKYMVESRRLKQKLKKSNDKNLAKGATKKKPCLRIAVEEDSDGSLDWNLEDQEKHLN